MPQIKHFTAKKDLTLDCGHAIKKGEQFQITSVFSCDKEATWPLTILTACFQVIRKKREAAKAKTKA